MIRKAILTAIVIFALLGSLFVGMHTIDLAKANFFPGDILIIYSPSYKMVYTNTSVLFYVAAIVANPTPEVVSITYSLDENSNITLNNLNKTLRAAGDLDGSHFYTQLLLENLAEGNHKLNAYSIDASGKQMFKSVEFVIDAQYTSPLSVLSPQNITYFTIEVPLTFICRETNRYDGNFRRAGYVIDGIGFDYFYDNLTLTDLSIGNHIIDVTVWTDNFQLFSEKIYFTVSNQTLTTPLPSNSSTQQPTLNPSPTPTLSTTNSPTQQPTIEPEPSPTISESLAWITILLIATLSVLGALILRRKKLS